jgi:branched-chain amino acid transport system substrate-binding protein
MMMGLVIISSCGGDSAQDPHGSASGPGLVDGVSATEIVLGSHNDLSGPLALIGTAAINGARMRFDEVNAAGGIHGRNIRLIVEDTGYQVPRAIQAVNKLINRDKIFAMTLGMGTPMNNAIMAGLFEKGIPNLFPLSGARSMFEPLRPLQFTQSGSYYADIRAATRYFIEAGSATTPCVIYQDTDYGQEILDGATDQLRAMDLRLAEVSAHKPVDTEFTTAVLRLRRAGCDLILMGTGYRDTVLILQTAHKLDWTGIRWVATEAAYNSSIAQLPSGAAEGFIASCSMALLYAEDDNPPHAAAWLKRYVERFGITPEYLAITSYRAADLIVMALEVAGPDLTRESFITALESIDNYQDIFGYHLSFSPQNHNGVNTTVLSEVRDGRWHKLDQTINY